MQLRISIILVSLFFSFTVLSQRNSYQGLLWEITGNGLESPSFLYGTMHVSNKLAFNVSDSFYLAMNSADAIALESSPADWMEDYRDMGAFSIPDYSYGGFYKKAFSITPPDNGVAYELMENKNGLMNQILYRFNPGNADYQENTFLDMFIFQAGAKNNKPIYSLETLKEVIDLSVKAMKPDEDKEIDNDYNNYLESDGQRKFVMLEEAYRKGDLDQIDSLSKADNPTSVYHDYFIVERNKNMVRRIDSIVKTHSLFIGIGAAHLPGDFGAIELLREMGYSVRAVNPKSTGKSHKYRKKLENLYRPIDFKQNTTSDGFIQVSVPGKLYEMPTSKRGKMEYLCPEPVNGGYFSIVRMFTYGGIFGKDADFYKKTFDSLIYIATPGELIKKEDIEVNGHKGFRILTLTSKNAYVNYNVFFTPTEILVFKGFGIGEYIQKNDPKRFFSEITLAENHSNWTNISPKYSGAKWQMKGLVTGQDMIDGLDDNSINPIYQSYDNENNDYYMVMRYMYNDLDYIEADSFDLAYLGKKFADKNGYEIQDSKFFAENGFSYVLQNLQADESHKNQTKNLKVKIITQGGNYYLMTTTANTSNSDTFFESFKFQNYTYPETFEEYVDTNYFYTVETIVKDENLEMPSFRRPYRNSDSDEDNTFLSSNGTNYHKFEKTGEKIYMGYVKFHDYYGVDSLESYWKRRIIGLTLMNKMKVSERVDTIIDGNPTLSFVLTDTNSSKGILSKYILHHGSQYLIQALVDTVAGPSEYVTRFFNTFTPKDTLIGRDLFEDKAKLFFDHVNGADSLNRVNAMKSIRKIDFKEKDVAGIIAIYRTFEFEEEEEQEQRKSLIMALGDIESQEVIDFLDQVYKENNFNSELQFSALKSLSYTETEEAYEAIKTHLLTNPPFTEKSRNLQFFDNLYDSLELSNNYYPEMLDLIQYSDYHPHILELLARGYLDTIYDFNKFKTEKSAIFRNANIELKRTVANQNEEENSYSYNYGSYSFYSQNSAEHTLFLDYYTLMCGFKKNGDTDVSNFFKDIYRIEDEKFKVEAEIIHHKLGLPVDTTILNEIAQDIEFRVWVYNRLNNSDMLEMFDSTITQEDMAFAILFATGYDDEVDTVAFIKSIVVNNGNEDGRIYFFKRKGENKKNWEIGYVGLMPMDKATFETKNMTTKKGLSVKSEEDIEETIERTIEIFELENRKRVIQNSYDYGSIFDGLF